jgi:hypothetical protein
MDWPVTYDDVEPDYCLAEWSIGVSADRRSRGIRIPFQKGYEFPMPIPRRTATRSSKLGADGRTGESALSGDGHACRRPELDPQSARPSTQTGRQGNRSRRPYRPVGAVGNPTWAPLRNARPASRSARASEYSALKTIDKLDRRTVTLEGHGPWSQAASVTAASAASSTCRHDTESDHRGARPVSTGRARDRERQAAAGLGRGQRRDQIGRNLMDHLLVLLGAGAVDGIFRGPLQSSGIESLRDGGEFRRKFAAFASTSATWDGTSSPMPIPYDDRRALARTCSARRCGAHLRHRVPRQVVWASTSTAGIADSRHHLAREFKDAIGCYRRSSGTVSLRGNRWWSP